jgi:FKBP-type peptidyl-prolyl cis-trans isomerase FkpA
MKKYFLLFTLLAIGISSCKKDNTFDPAKQAATDDALIKAYIAANNITATKDPSGLYYSILIPGTGPYPTASSTVSVNYSGILLNGSVFAPTSHLQQPLTSLIRGWQIGIPFINAGGRILLIVPSALGYGNSSPGPSIPANSVLVFTIDLLSFTN